MSLQVPKNGQLKVQFSFFTVSNLFLIHRNKKLLNSFIEVNKKKNKRQFHVRPIIFHKMGQFKTRDPEPDPGRKL